MSVDAETFPFGQEVVWQPNPQWMAESNLRAFMDRHAVVDYPALLARAAADPAWFWDAALRDLGIEFYTPYSRVLDLQDGIRYPRCGRREASEKPGHWRVSTGPDDVG